MPWSATLAYAGGGVAGSSATALYTPGGLTIITTPPSITVIGAVFPSPQYKQFISGKPIVFETLTATNGQGCLLQGGGGAGYIQASADF